MHVNLRTGTVMSLADTATGRLFSAYMPSKVIEQLLDNELARKSYGPIEGKQLTSEVLESLLAEVRRHGLSRAKGHPIPGIDALCAPVFDSAGHIVLGILVMGPAATFDSDWDGMVAQPLLRCAAEIARRIGRA